MKNTSKNILIIVVLCVIIIAIGYVVSNNNQPSSPQTVVDNSCSPDYKHSFDTPIALGDSGVIVRYPTQGFFGHGIDVSQETNNGRNWLHIQPTKDYRVECGEEFVTVGLSVQKTEVNTLDEVVDMISHDGYGEVENPRFVILNGKRYFTYYIREGVDDIEAITLQNGMVIYANIAYKETDFNDAMTVLSRNQDLLLEFMSNISSE